jgi:hypothetical protein
MGSCLLLLAGQGGRDLILVDSSDPIEEVKNHSPLQNQLAQCHLKEGKIDLLPSFTID